jgi:hypothetical protein
MVRKTVLRLSTAEVVTKRAELRLHYKKPDLTKFVVNQVCEPELPMALDPAITGAWPTSEK